MKKLFKLLLSSLFVAGTGIAMADELIVGDGAEWIWKRAAWFIRRCEILDFWHAMEHAWDFARATAPALPGADGS